MSDIRLRPLCWPILLSTSAALFILTTAQPTSVLDPERLDPTPSTLPVTVSGAVVAATPFSAGQSSSLIATDPITPTGQHTIVQQPQNPLAIPRRLAAKFLAKDGYQFITPLPYRLKGVTHMGMAARLRAVLNNMLNGQDVTVLGLGGSVSAGYAGVSFHKHFADWLQTLFGQVKVQHLVTAIPGTQSAYVSACFDAHVPDEADIVLVDFAMNDFPKPDHLFQTPIRRALERLLRRLLNLPNKPAVILVNMYTYAAGTPAGAYYNNAERDFMELATYYDLPSVSFKAAFHQPIASGQVPGWNLTDLYCTANAKHPCQKGHVATGELLITLVRSLMADLDRPDLDAEVLAAEVAAPLPTPMVKRNYEALTSSCYIYHKLLDLVSHNQGWRWTDEGLGAAKHGLVAVSAGDQLQLTLNSKATAGSRHKEVMVQLAYLESYSHMGVVKVQCVANCSCPLTTIDAHQPVRNASVTHIANVAVTQHPYCSLMLTVSDVTQSGEHKFKVMGVIVAEESGMESGPIKSLRSETARRYHSLRGRMRHLKRKAADNVTRL